MICLRDLSNASLEFEIASMPHRTDARSVATCCKRALKALMGGLNFIHMTGHANDFKFEQK